MKLTSLLGALLIFSALDCLAEDTQPATPAKDGHQHKDIAATVQTASRSLGLFYGKNIGSAFKELDFKQLMKGFEEGFSGKVPQDKLRQANTTVEEFLRTQQLEKSSAAIAKSQAYLQANAKKPNVKSTPSGLQYEIIKEGKGKSPKANDEVTVHYRGTLSNGTEFDSSYSRGEPTRFQLGNVIPGWTEGLQLMKEGATYKFTIPPALGYGENGAGQTIGPNEVLIFEIELVKIGSMENSHGKAK